MCGRFIFMRTGPGKTKQANLYSSLPVNNSGGCRAVFSRRIQTRETNLDGPLEREANLSVCLCQFRLPWPHSEILLGHFWTCKLFRRRLAERYEPKVPIITAGNARPHEHNRSEEHTSELQSLTNLVCRLLLEKKNTAAQALDALRAAHPTVVTGRVGRTL